jgi:hypothetical protein
VISPAIFFGNFFLTGPITELSFDLNVSRILECSSVMWQLAPDHDGVPSRAAVVSSQIVLPARVSGLAGTGRRQGDDLNGENLSLQDQRLARNLRLSWLRAE